MATVELTLTEDSKRRLLKAVDYMTDGGKELTTDSKIYCNRMIIERDAHEDTLKWAEEHKGEKFFLETTKVGLGENIAALQVKTPMWSNETLKHIVLYSYNGKGEFDAGTIPQWFKIKDKSQLHQHLAGTIEITE